MNKNELELELELQHEQGNRPPPEGGGGVFLCIGYIAICGPKGYALSAVLVINRVWFLHSCLKLCLFFLEEATFSSLSIRSSTKALHKLCLGQLYEPQWS